MKKHFLKPFLLVFFIVFLTFKTLSQNVVTIPQSYEDAKTIVEDNKLKISGGFNLSQILYGVNGIQSRRSPYTYFATGNLNFSIFQINLPLSFTYTNQEFSFERQVPVFEVNQLSLRPKYKWIQLYLGHNNLSFSPYTLNGHQFLGVGAELTPPGHLNISALYGRFQKVVRPEEAAILNTPPSYERWGYGFKLGYQFDARLSKRKKLQIESIYDRDGNIKPAGELPQPIPEEEVASSTDLIEFTFFTAQDDINSLPNLPDSLGVFPEANVAMSAHLNKTFLKRMVIDVELGGSALTRDDRIEAIDENDNTAFIITDPIFTRKISTAYYTAIRTQLDYRGDWFTVGGSYERIDPEYRTLGAYFFNNDLENIALNVTTNLLENKLNLAVSLGTQRNNLNDAKLSTQSRLSSNININFIPSQKINFNLNYSNLQSFVRVIPQFANATQLTAQDNLADSLNFTQIVQSINFNTNYQLSNDKEKKQFINLNVSWQEAADRQQNNNRGSNFYNLNLSYNYGLPAIDLNIVAMINYNQNQAS